MKRGWMDMPGALNMPDAGTEQKTRIILVEDEGFFREMLRVSLTQSGRVEVVGDFADGEAALAAAPDLQPRPESSLARLTERQREILSFMAQGFNNAAIAQQLDLSPKTVENQINTIYGELAIRRSAAGVMPRVKAVLTYLRETREG